jgi:hypothetical protein
VEFATPLLFVSSTASANSLQVSRNFNNDMGKMKAWISGPRSQDYQNGQKTSKEMLVHAHTTEAEWFIGNALISARKDKTKTRAQGYLEDFTTATKQDAEEYFNSGLYALAEEALAQLA